MQQYNNGSPGANKKCYEDRTWTDPTHLELSNFVKQLALEDQISVVPGILIDVIQCEYRFDKCQTEYNWHRQTSVHGWWHPISDNIQNEKLNDINIKNVTFYINYDKKENCFCIGTKLKFQQDNSNENEMMEMLKYLPRDENYTCSDKIDSNSKVNKNVSNSERIMLNKDYDYVLACWLHHGRTNLVFSIS